jgi:hypothetical protein
MMETVPVTLSDVGWIQEAVGHDNFFDDIDFYAILVLCKIG